MKRIGVMGLVDVSDAERATGSSAHSLNTIGDSMTYECFQNAAHSFICEYLTDSALHDLFIDIEQTFDLS